VYNLLRMLKESSGKAFVDVYRHGGFITRVVFELPYYLVSKVGWVDFLVEDVDPELVSHVEKVVLRRLWGFRPVVLGLVTFFSLDGPVLPGDMLRISLIDDTPLEYRVGGYSPLVDIGYSYSWRMPSRWRPGFTCMDEPPYLRLGIQYLNYPGPLVDADLVSRLDGGLTLLPPNPLGMLETPVELLGSGVEVVEAGGGLVEKYVRVLEDVGPRTPLLVPLIYRGGPGLEATLIMVSGDGARVVGPLYEGEEYVVDLTYSYGGSKPAIVFKWVWRSPPMDGDVFAVNLGVGRYPPPAHLYVEYWRGGRLLWSSSSRRGLVELALW